MLLVLWAEPAIVRTAGAHLVREAQWNGPRLIELGQPSIGLRVAIDEGFEAAVVRASLSHVNLAVTQHDMGIDHAPALRTDAPGELEEDVVGVTLQLGHRRRQFGHGKVLQFRIGCATPHQIAGDRRLVVGRPVTVTLLPSARLVRDAYHIPLRLAVVTAPGRHQRRRSGVPRYRRHTSLASRHRDARVTSRTRRAPVPPHGATTPGAAVERSSRSSCLARNAANPSLA